MHGCSLGVFVLTRVACMYMCEMIITEEKKVMRTH